MLCAPGLAGYPDATLAGNRRDLSNSWGTFSLGPRWATHDGGLLIVHSLCDMLLTACLGHMLTIQSRFGDSRPQEGWQNNVLHCTNLHVWPCACVCSTGAQWATSPVLAACTYSSRLPCPTNVLLMWSCCWRCNGRLCGPSWQSRRWPLLECSHAFPDSGRQSLLRDSHAVFRVQRATIDPPLLLQKLSGTGTGNSGGPLCSGCPPVAV